MKHPPASDGPRPEEDWRAAGFGLYIHWPFCQSKCPYCDFNSHVAARIDQRRWAAAYGAEIARLAAETGPRTLSTIFFGGGTPSLMAPETVAATLEAARAAWPVANDLEVTLEANPGSADAARFRAYHEAGVTRLSMGVQALNDADLRRLGRLHDAAEARAAFARAREIFPRVSFDLIYARQHQSAEAWAAELREALALALDHLSLYQLTIEEGTAFGARAAAGGLRGLPDEALSAELYELTQELCEAAGMPAYEVSNHARPGAESRHNLIYWRCGDYAGIGPGAHGRLTLRGQRWATEAPRDPEAWLRAVERAGAGELPRTALSPADVAEEYLMMSLRLAEGLDRARYARLGGALEEERLSFLAELGLLTVTPERIAATREGRLVLNRLTAVLAGYSSAAPPERSPQSRSRSLSEA